MKKLILVLITLLLLVGCSKLPVGSTPQEIPTMTSSVAENSTAAPELPDIYAPAFLSGQKRWQMEQTWQSNSDNQISWHSDENIHGTHYYYGSYGGYDIVLWQTNLTAVTTLVIGSEEFYCNTSFVLFAYSDGKWEHLQEVYGQELISSKDVYAIAQYHRKWMESQWPDRDYMTQYLRQDIENAWLEKTGQPIGEWYDDLRGTNPQGIRYYATYNGYDILFVNAESDPASCTVADMEFRHEAGFALYAYRDGAFYPLTDAYDRGFLTDTHIAYLLAIHQWHEQEICGVESDKDETVK